MGPMLTHLDPFGPVLTLLNPFWPVSTILNQFDPLDRFCPILYNFDQFWPILTCFHIVLPSLTCFYPFWLVFTNFDKFWPDLTHFDPYCSALICFDLPFFKTCFTRFDPVGAVDQKLAIITLWCTVLHHLWIEMVKCVLPPQPTVSIHWNWDNLARTLYPLRCWIKKLNTCPFIIQVGRKTQMGIISILKY